MFEVSIQVGLNHVIGETEVYLEKLTVRKSL